MRKLWFLAVALVALPLGAQLQSMETNPLEPHSPECALGVKYDSGVFPSTVANTANPNWIAVMRFTLPPGTTGLKQVCVRISRSGPAAVTVPYDIVVFDDNGPSGQPGTLLKSVSGTVTLGTPPAQFVSADFTGFSVPDLNVYVGVRMSGTAAGLSVDGQASTPAQTLAFSETNGFSWIGVSSNVKAFAVRVDPVPECISSATAMCLNGRFRVEATYGTASSSGAANGVRLTDETGYLWFFSPTNVEAVVKVLNACGINNSFWVFAGGLTDVNTVLKITDVRTGQVKTYTNPQGTPFQPIQDVNAFSGPGVCP